MKTSLKKNKKVLAATLAVFLSLSGLFGIWTVVYAQDQKETGASASDKAVQSEVEVNVKYLFEDETVFMEEKIKAEKGQILDSGDLPMITDDMKFIDEFLFYEVKGDGTDEIIRKVVKIEKADKETQTEEENPKPEDTTQTNEPNTSDKGTQTDLTTAEMESFEAKIKELEDKINKLTSENVSKDELNKSQKDEIESLKENIKALEEKLRNKDNSNLDKEKEELKNQIETLGKKIASLQADIKSGKGDGSGNASGGVFRNITEGGINNSYSDDKGKGSTVYSNDTTKESTGDDEESVRYPNKLTSSTPANNTQNSDGTANAQNTNKGVASEPSKARGTVTENVDNANNDYPIHHGDETDDMASDMYSADARQFVTFQTKNGKTFHLIINHDEDGENVMLLTEVSEDDLLNMVETKEEPAKEETVPQKEISEPKEEPKKEEEKKSDLGTYILLILVVAGALGGGYYFKVIKNKEKKELENLEEEDDFFSESEEYEESEVSEGDDFVENEETDEEDI